MFRTRMPQARKHTCIHAHKTDKLDTPSNKYMYAILPIGDSRHNKISAAGLQTVRSVEHSPKERAL